MSGTLTLSIDGTKEVGNTKIAPVQKARAHTVSIPQGTIMAGYLSMADLLNWVVLWGIPIQKNDDFTVKVNHMIVNTDTLTHQSTYTSHHLPPFILLP